MALPASRSTREFEKFVDDGSGNTAIRAVIIGGGGGGGNPGTPNDSIQYRINGTTFGGVSDWSSDGTTIRMNNGVQLLGRDFLDANWLPILELNDFDQIILGDNAANYFYVDTAQDKIGAALTDGSGSGQFEFGITTLAFTGNDNLGNTFGVQADATEFRAQLVENFTDSVELSIKPLDGKIEMANATTEAKLEWGATTGIFQWSYKPGTATGPVFDLYFDADVPAADDTWSFNFSGKDSLGLDVIYGRIRSVIVDPTSTTESGRLDFGVRHSGADVFPLRLQNGQVRLSNIANIDAEVVTGGVAYFSLESGLDTGVYHWAFGAGTTVPSDGATGWTAMALFNDADATTFDRNWINIGNSSSAAFRRIAYLNTDGQLAFGLGSVSAPTFSFAGNENTGLYSSAPNNIDLTIVGTRRFNFVSNQIRGNAGSAAVPIYTFIGDPDTGPYSVAANNYGIATGGVVRTITNDSGFYVVNGGSTTVAAIGLNNSQGTGFSSDGSNMRFLLSNVERATLTADGRLDILVGGTGLASAVGLGRDTSNGVFINAQSGANAEIRTNNVTRIRVASATNIQFSLPLTWSAVSAPASGAIGIGRYASGQQFNVSTGNDHIFTVNGVTSVTFGANTIGFNGASPVAQSTAIADASGGAVVDSEARTAINTLLAYLRTRGDIAT